MLIVLPSLVVLYLRRPQSGAGGQRSTHKDSHGQGRRRRAAEMFQRPTQGRYATDIFE